MSCGTSGPSTSASPARTMSPEWTRKCLLCVIRCSRSMPLSLRTMIDRLPRFFSRKSSTVPSISAITAGSFGLRASKISVTRGRPPVMSCVPRGFARRLGDERTGRNHLAFVDFQVGPLGHVVEVENLAVVRVFDDDLRMHVALVFHDDVANVTAGVLFAPHRLAFDQVFEANLAARFGQNRDAVRVPFAEDGRRPQRCRSR